MAAPVRRKALGRAPRAEGTHPVGSLTGEVGVPVMLPGASVSEPSSGDARASEATLVVAPSVGTAEQRQVTDADPESGEDWAYLQLPAPALPSLEFVREDLVAGPVRLTTMYLPAVVATGLRQTKFELDVELGSPVTQSAIILEAMAYAFTHVHMWVDRIPVDGRRRHGSSTLSLTGARTSAHLPEALRDAVEAVVWSAAASGRPAPARITVQATALGWGLLHRSEWVRHLTAGAV